MYIDKKNTVGINRKKDGFTGNRQMDILIDRQMDILID